MTAHPMNPQSNGRLVRASASLAVAMGLWLGIETRAAEAPDAATLRKQALELLGPIPDKMPGADKDTPALVKLGKELYFEKALSENQTQSCNSCHQVEGRKGGVDNEPTSPGAFGKRGGRNSPTTLNAGFQLAQFWDGRADDLVAQAKGPVLNPVEMAMPSEEVVVKRLKGLPKYGELFRGAFPGVADPITYHNMAVAIAAFERTLITRDRFDDFLKGKDAALSAVELKGLQEFLTLGCTTCHYGPVVGGQVYQKIGLVNTFPTDDKGRFDVTKDEDDQFKFKVPMLRNIAITGPYFHKGQIATLEEAVRKMAWHQLGKEVSDDQVKTLVAFLQSLTDKARASSGRAGVHAEGAGPNIATR
ncbi:MAG: c-type cytochrome [Verrucomicrobiales bacterium]|nr:c-type cytochrome [Verrucomicrobiales bacterium]